MNKRIMGLATALTLLFLCACSQTNEGEAVAGGKEEGKDSLVLSFENPQTNQEFKIVRADKLFEGLREKIEKNTERSELDVYKEVVIDPVYQDCFANAEYPYMADSILHSTPSVYTPLPTLSEEIEEKQVEETIKQALIKSSNLLPSDKETTVCVFPTTKPVPMFTVGAGKIIVLYNKYYDDSSIKAGIAHEYHHSVWTEKYLTDNASTTVLDNLIFEGKAVMFEKIAYPDITFTPIDERYHQEHWESIENDFHKADFNRSMEIISGGKGLPDLYGYSEGYKMVQSYLKLHPELTPEEWTPIKALEIFNDGNYIDNYQ